MTRRLQLRSPNPRLLQWFAACRCTKDYGGQYWHIWCRLHFLLLHWFLTNCAALNFPFFIFPTVQILTTARNSDTVFPFHQVIHRCYRLHLRYAGVRGPLNFLQPLLSSRCIQRPFVVCHVSPHYLQLFPPVIERFIIPPPSHYPFHPTPPLSYIYLTFLSIFSFAPTMSRPFVFFACRNQGSQALYPSQSGVCIPIMGKLLFGSRESFYSYLVWKCMNHVPKVCSICIIMAARKARKACAWCIFIYFNTESRKSRTWHTRQIKNMNIGTVHAI